MLVELGLRGQRDRIVLEVLDGASVTDFACRIRSPDAANMAALGVPFGRRARQAEEYVAAMRRIWRDDVATFQGTFTQFDGIRVNPRPIRDRRVPIFIGGNSAAALGVDEMVVVASPSDDAGLASSWVEQLAHQWLG
jgi:alkanesulfonate monooxygenase SsuD/methylene tetrahydromethanopterin reductase-like flavin-dependent oxidoreductase (luciferase family)